MRLLNGPRVPRYQLRLIHPLGPLFRHLPLALRRHLLFLRAHSRWGNFTRPTLWSEKIQWRIINDRRPIIAFTCDKLASGEYVKRFVEPNSPHIKFPATYWVGTDLRELRQISHTLPARWILKPNHSSGRIAYINSDQEPIDWDALITIGDQWMRADEESFVFGHWAYTQARHLLLVQEHIGDGQSDPADLRILGNAGCINIAFCTRDYGTERFQIAIYASDLRTRVRVGTPYETPLNQVSPLDQISTELRSALTELATSAAAPFDEIRVDGLLVGDTFWFVELTPYPTSGLARRVLASENAIGAMWKLPDLTANDPREAEWRALLEGVPKGTLQQGTQQQ